jgi:hypothetical protein
VNCWVPFTYRTPFAGDIDMEERVATPPPPPSPPPPQAEIIVENIKTIIKPANNLWSIVHSRITHVKIVIWEVNALVILFLTAPLGKVN